MRLGTKGLNTADATFEAELRGINFTSLLTMPEQDDWIYSDGPNMYVSRCIAHCMLTRLSLGCATSLFCESTKKLVFLAILLTRFRSPSLLTGAYILSNSLKLMKTSQDPKNVK